MIKPKKKTEEVGMNAWLGLAIIGIVCLIVGLAVFSGSPSRTGKYKKARVSISTSAATPAVAGNTDWSSGASSQQTGYSIIF